MTSTKRAFKDDLYEQFARLGKALSSSRRLEILDLLSQGPRTVESIAAETDQTVQNTSQHLLALKASGLLKSAKSGLYVSYELASPNVSSFLLAFRQLAEEQNAEIERLAAHFFDESPQPMDVQELSDHLKRGHVVLVDVRPKEEYDAGHLPGALSVPVRHLESELHRLPKRKRIVAYCRGPYCVYAHDAVKLLRKRGYKADRLEEGVVEWKELGLAIEA